MLATKLITVSGVHGVGKSETITQLRKKIGFTEGSNRPSNPFQTPYEAMLFFIAAFSKRDQDVNKLKASVLLDRWSSVDIEVYINSLSILKYINSNEALVLSNALHRSSSENLIPDLAILLDDDPENILNRIKSFRIPSKHHIYERDIEFIKTLRKNFLNVFENLKTRDQYKELVVLTVFVNNRTYELVAEEILEKISNHFF